MIKSVICFFLQVKALKCSYKVFLLGPLNFQIYQVRFIFYKNATLPIIFNENSIGKWVILIFYNVVNYHSSCEICFGKIPNF